MRLAVVGKGGLWSQIGLLLLVGLLAGSQGAAEGRQADPDYLKASFSYRLVHFVTWPEPAEKQAADEPMDFCVMARPAMAEALVRVSAQRKIKGRSIRVQSLSSGDSMRPCEVLFVGSGQIERFEREQASIGGLPILVIGEASGFAERGGMINLIPEGRKLSFEINQEALKEVGLRPASQLLRLARQPVPAKQVGAP